MMHSVLAPTLSVGLSDLGGVVHCIHSPSLRSGLCWYRIGLSDLVAPTVRLLPAPTERPDTSIAQRAMSIIHPKFQGLKDRWIFPRLMLSTRTNPYFI
jgi:hypothetical protein